MPAKGVYSRLKGVNPLIIGWHIVIVVTEVGTSVTNFKKADEVSGIVNFPGQGKAYACCCFAVMLSLCRVYSRGR